jgi:hypothetical protein
MHQNSIALKVPHLQHPPGRGISSSIQIPFGRIKGPFGVGRLHGCTSVIVISEASVWISHLWEEPAFRQGQSLFEREVLDFLSSGSGSGSQLMPGLNHNTDYLPDKDPRIFVITPQPEEGPAGAIQYLDQVQQIKSHLSNLLPNIGIEVHTYVRAKFDEELDQTLLGKVTIQYDPNQPNCNGIQQPAYRIWLMDQVIIRRTWPANIHQRRQIPGEPLCPSTMLSANAPGSIPLHGSASTAQATASTDTMPLSVSRSTPAPVAPAASSKEPSPPSQTAPAASEPSGSAPSSPAAAPAPVPKRNIHVWQALGQDLTQAQVYIHANITEARGVVIGSGGGPLDWGQSLNITTDTKPPHTVRIIPQTGVKTKRETRLEYRNPGWHNSNTNLARDFVSINNQTFSNIGAPALARPLFQKGPVEFSVDKRKPFDTTSPLCRVGGWDNGGLDDFLASLVGGLFLPVSDHYCSSSIKSFGRGDY